MTFSLFLTDYEIIPPKQFRHDPNIKGGYYKNLTVGKCLQYNHLMVPNEWYEDECKECYYYNPEYINNALNGIIYDRPDNVKAETQYEYEYTVAMLYAQQGVIPPKCWEHNPELQNENEETVAMILAKNKIYDIPIQWQHKSKLKDSFGCTVAMHLAENGIIPPKEWQHNSLRKNTCGYTVAVFLETNNIETPKQWLYDPEYRLINNMTTAMKIANEGKIPSKYWYHKPELQNNNGNSVAMYLAENKILDIPRQWNHDPLLKNNYQNTVAMIYAYEGIIPPKEWMHDIDIKDNSNNSIRSFLYEHNYFYINNEFIKLTEDTVQQCIQTEILNDTCQICLNDDEQIFIKSICTHRICIDCFKEIFKINNYKYCPICRQEQWFQLIDQSQ